MHLVVILPDRNEMDPITAPKHTRNWTIMTLHIHCLRHDIAEIRGKSSLGGQRISVSTDILGDFPTDRA